MQTIHLNQFFFFFFEVRVHGKSADSVLYRLSGTVRMLILKIHADAGFFIFRANLPTDLC